MEWKVKYCAVNKNGQERKAEVKGESEEEALLNFRGARHKLLQQGGDTKNSYLYRPGGGRTAIQG